MTSPTEGGKLSFERDIKPLFRTKDRDAMQAAFDLFEYEDVVENAKKLNLHLGLKFADFVEEERASHG